ncbi:response regulator transcription factor [Oleiharenicola sp. Vm1]|uniref:response regulator transcription factor n=1 Tax=Oleiharenicola sp. Vm1 TaxID=3398393 RepID=UPI0039F50C8C
MKATTPIEGGTAASHAPAAAKKILLVDDHPITRQGLRTLISQQPGLTVVGESDNAAQAMELATKLEPDIAIVDIALRSANGIELTKNLKAHSPGLLILIVSMHDEDLFAERALRAGARGYLMKHEASEKVVEALEKIAAGELYISERVRARMLSRLVNNRTGEVTSPVESLSDREMEVFQLIGNGYATRQIAERLNLSVKTIDSYREHLKLKLNLDSGADLVRYAIQWVKSQDSV